MILIFRDLITGSNTNGHQFICDGEFEVIIDRIPADAPQDWEFGPKQTPGAWGAYRRHEFYPCQHGPCAFAVAKDADGAFTAACGCFAGKWCAWPRLSNEQRLMREDCKPVAAAKNRK